MTHLDSTTATDDQSRPRLSPTACDVDIVVPVYNEAASLEPSIRRLHGFLREQFPLRWRITIVDNASDDSTWLVACRLRRELPGLDVLRLADKGRGRALHAAWGSSEATVLAYMDVDLSTDLTALLPLVAPLLSGHSDLAIGSRLAPGARVVRGPKREVISRCYNLILRTTLGARFSDAQCGFKAIRRDQAARLLPTVLDQHWFFDTELLIRAQRLGLRIHEVPVDWVDDPDSRVHIVTTARDDLRGIGRLLAERLRTPWMCQLACCAGIGVFSTVGYLALYVALRTAVPAVTANAVSLAVTTVANTAANRRFTFRVRDRHGRYLQQLQGFLAFLVALLTTTAAAAMLRYAEPQPSRTAEATVLVLANLGATVVRFQLLRSWVFATSITTSRILEGQS